MAATLERTSTPGVYARGSRWVAVYLEDGRQRRRSAQTFRAAREIKVRATAREAARRAGPTVHAYALEWVDHYAGRGAHDVINAAEWCPIQRWGRSGLAPASMSVAAQVWRNV